MSAWNEIVAYGGDDEWLKLCSKALEEIQNAYAHRLAERIRNSKGLRAWTDGHMSDCNMAADLIDPEMK